MLSWPDCNNCPRVWLFKNDAGSGPTNEPIGAVQASEMLSVDQNDSFVEVYTLGSLFQAAKQVLGLSKRGSVLTVLCPLTALNHTVLNHTQC